MAVHKTSFRPEIEIITVLSRKGCQPETALQLSPPASSCFAWPECWLARLWLGEQTRRQSAWSRWIWWSHRTLRPSCRCRKDFREGFFQRQMPNGKLSRWWSRHSGFWEVQLQGRQIRQRNFQGRRRSESATRLKSWATKVPCTATNKGRKSRAMTQILALLRHSWHHWKVLN